MGMPSELWSRKKVREVFGEITGFLDGPAENPAAKYYKAGQFTDDTAQALAIISALEESRFRPDGRNAIKAILQWAETENAFEKNILGITSKAALRAFQKGESTEAIANTALSNGAAMRIPPIGCLFQSGQLKELAAFVREISYFTHASDIAVAGASIIAAAVTIAIETGDAKSAVRQAIELEPYALSMGEETFSPSIRGRVLYGITFAEQHKDREDDFLDFLYSVIGAGGLACESVSTALLIAYYMADPNRCALAAANLGGDTDTIGAMAAAIGGAALGVEAIHPDYIHSLEQANPTNFTEYTQILTQGRKILQNRIGTA